MRAQTLVATADKPATVTRRTTETVAAYYRAQRHLRRGICFLNAGQFDEAIREFNGAAAFNPSSLDLPRFLVAVLAGAGRHSEAVRAQQRQDDESEDTATAAIRLALLQWKANDATAAIRTLRDAVAVQPDSADLHFQLGTMLAAMDEHEEAELRFTQAISIDKTHADALVAIALCHGVRHDAAAAVASLQRAQHLRPQDARIAVLLATAARAARANGDFVSARADMPATEPEQPEEAIEEISRMLEREPDFADAFLALDLDDVDETVYRMLLRTLQRAIERNPRHAELHYQCGRALARLGEADKAIAEIERAVEINPRFVKALLQLARLYEQTDRWVDAATRLEQTIQLGAEYADTYYLLGNLYRNTGQLDRARGAYLAALRINQHYDAARQALETLAA